MTLIAPAFDRARKQMIDTQLLTIAVTDKRVLAAVGRVPRERFVPAAWRDLAYADSVIPLNSQRLLGPVAPFARFLQLASITQTDRVLDIGCATGYSAAVLAHLSEHVTAFEADTVMVQQARETLSGLNLGHAKLLEAVSGNLPRGIGPFDVIVLEDPVETVPQNLFALLADGGRLVASIAGSAKAIAHLYVRSGDDVAGRPDFDTNLTNRVQRAEASSFVF